MHLVWLIRSCCFKSIISCQIAKYHIDVHLSVEVSCERPEEILVAEVRAVADEDDV